MKKIILSAVIMSIGFAAQSQEIPERKSERPHMMERKKHHQGMEFKKLNLTEDQKAKFKSQNETFRKKMEELKKNDNITVKDWKAKAENLRKEHKANMDGILTSDQKAQLEKMKVEAKDKQSVRTKESGAKMKADLGLTDDQSAKMQANRKEMGEKMKAIRGNNSLSDEQKKEQVKELMKKQKEYMKSVLTEEQLKKLKETKPKRPEGERKKQSTKQTI